MTGGLRGDARKRNLALVPCCDAAAAVARVEAVATDLLGLHRKECSSEFCATCDCGWDLTSEQYEALRSGWEAYNAYESHVAQALRAALDGAAGGGGGS
ncbi:MAG: hypothetical protein ACXVXW_04875 [Mycobacteriaceae bacterium]